MNGRKGDLVRTPENREGAWPPRPSLSEVGFRNHREGRADCALHGRLSLQNTSRAQAPGLPQPARNQEV